MPGQNKSGGDRRGVRASGFTLLEMMLVVAIIGILMSVAVYNMVATGDKARRRATEATMRVVENSIKMFKNDKGSFPPNLQSLVTEKYMEKVFKDAWKHDLMYATPGAGGKDYSLVSLGADGQQGTDDDIDVWKIDEETPSN